VVGGQRRDPATLSPEKRPSADFTGCWVGLGAGLDAFPFKCSVNLLSIEQSSTNTVTKSLHLLAAAGLSDISDL